MEKANCIYVGCRTKWQMALLKCLVGMALITSALMWSAVNRSCRFPLVYCLIYLLFLPDLPLIILVEYL